MEFHVLLTGRLGNQLFQYAIAKYLQKEYGGKIHLNQFDLIHRSGDRKKVSSSAFKYEMAEFELDNDVKLEDVKMPWFADLSHPLIRVAKKIAPKFLFSTMAKRGYLLWQRSDYIQIPNLKCDSVFIHGYWQDIKYLEGIQKELSKKITPTATVPLKNKYLYDLAEKPGSVCISIRGGNYLNQGIKQSLFVCDRNYFIHSIRKMDEYVHNPTYIVFSDDLKWVKDYICLEKEFPEKSFYFEDGTDTVSEKIRLMSRCENFIISNSSFSWWAQYLSVRKEKKVIAPNKWFTDGRKCGLYMDNWILVEVD